MVLGNNGIISKSIEAKEKIEYAQLKQDIQLKLIEKEINSFSDSNIKGPSNKEIVEILKSYGDIDNGNLKIDDKKYPIEDLLGNYNNKILPSTVIIGYWENYVNTAVESSTPLKLSQISDNYDIINVSFARWDATKNDGTITFEPNSYLLTSLNYTEKEFQKDIYKLQSKGQKVLVSIGGSGGGNIQITNDTQAENFANSIIEIIDEYSFNGIDIDIETNSNVVVVAEYFEKAIRKIYNHYANNLIITLNSSCTEMRSENSQANHTEAIWHQCASRLKDVFSVVSCRYYNSGNQIGADFPNVWSRPQGSISFITSQVVKQLEDPSLNPSTIGMTILSYNAEQNGGLPAAYLTPDKVSLAIESIMKGTDPQETSKNFVPSKAHPEFRAVVIWSINSDSNNQMVTAVRECLDNI